MGAHPTHESLRQASDEDLIKTLDEMAGRTVVGTQFYIDELNSRAQSKITVEVQRFTKQMRDMTILMLVLTVVNTWAAIYSIHNTQNSTVAAPISPQKQ
jgi:hypothetical protein